MRRREKICAYQTPCVHSHALTFGIYASGFSKIDSDFQADAAASKYLPAFDLPLFCANSSFDEKTSRFTLIRPKMFASGPFALTCCKPCPSIVRS